MPDEFVMPEGYRWCPDCNGDGTVVVNDPPFGDERHYDCMRCVEHNGLVPIEDVDYDPDSPAGRIAEHTGNTEHLG